MNEFEYLINKYKNFGLLIDTNLLILLLMGRHNPELISQFSRTETSTKEDYYLLERITSYFAQLITLPNVLTEVSNLIKSADRRMAEFHLTFINEINKFQELYAESSMVTNESSFKTLGLADSAIIQISRNNYLVITVDLPLYNFLLSNNLEVINFNHIRGEVWFNQ